MAILTLRAPNDKNHGKGNYHNVFDSNVFKNSDTPDYLNWVEVGAVTPVKDQGHCGACWAFSAIGALEGAYFIKHKELLSFSEQ